MLFLNRRAIFREGYCEMTRSDLIQRLFDKQSYLSYKQTDVAVRQILDQMALTLEQGNRIEIRGFGSFSVRYHAARMARNPKTSVVFTKEPRYTPHFKPGKKLREDVNASAAQYPLLEESEDLQNME